MRVHRRPTVDDITWSVGCASVLLGILLFGGLGLIVLLNWLFGWNL